MDPRNISISDYSYSLPEERIAKYPLAERDASRLLIYKNGSITEDIYRRIANQLPGNSLMVFNNTKVIEARLLFPKQTGGIIEIFCLEPAGQYQDVAKAMDERECVLWKCMIGGASKWRPGTILEKKIRTGKEEMVMKAAIRDRLADSFLIELNWGASHLSFAEVLHFAGAMPLPPYIKREAEEADTERYQTIYAKESGSVAAPTAGLHFTEPI